MADILKQNIIIIIFQLLDTTCCTSFYYTILQKINAVALNQGGGGIYVIFHIMCMQITLPVTRGTNFKRNIFV